MLFKFQLNAEKANVHIIYQRPSYTVEKNYCYWWMYCEWQVAPPSRQYK